MMETHDGASPGRPRLDVLIEQLGPQPVMETLGLDEDSLGRLQAGLEPETEGVRAGMKQLERLMGEAVDWWGEEPPVSEVAGVELEESGVPVEAALPAVTSAHRTWNWEEMREKRRQSLRAMLELAMASTARLGVTYQGQVAMLGLVAEIEYSLIVWGDTLPESGMDWDPDRRARETSRRIGRMIWVRREQEREYGGIRGVYNWLMGRKQMRPKELMARMMEESDGVMGLDPELEEAAQMMEEGVARREERMRRLEAGGVVEGESRSLP